MSIRLKLPLAAGGLILVVGGGLTGAAYLAMRHTVLEHAEARLTTLGTQLQENLRASVAAGKGRAQVAARRPALATYLRDPAEANRRAALEAMRYEGPQPELTRAVELRDASGKTVLTAGPDGSPVSSQLPSLGPRDDAPITRTLPQLDSPDSAAIGRFRQEGNSLLYPIAVRVAGLGFLVYWRIVSSTPQAREQIAGILGTEAAFFYGNADGSSWSDLGRLVAAPPINIPPGAQLVRYRRPGTNREVLAAAAPIGGTPWAFALEFPLDAVLAPARTFLREMALLAALALTLGVVVAWALSLNITSPLRRLTEAADAIALGRSSRRVDLVRGDELGSLAASFAAMAKQIEETHDHLDDLVTARTADLNVALQSLKETQESLVRREKLALLGQLAGGVGHELRNPLGVLSNAVYYLDKVLADQPADVKSYLRILRDQVTLSGKIVDDLLGFSRSAPQRVPLTVPDLVDSVLPRLPANDGIHLERFFPEPLPRVLADPAQASQVLLNLLTNAVQALEGAGGGGAIQLSGQARNGLVAIQVADTGPGIPTADLARVFEPLFTTKSRGTGLGLAISKMFAQMNGGDLTVTNGAGPWPGATFTFTLPVEGPA